MALTVTVVDVVDVDELPASVDLGSPAPDALVALLASGDGNAFANPSTKPVSVGGAPLAGVTHARLLSQYAALHESVGNALSGMQTLDVGGTTAGHVILYAVSGSGGGVVRVDSDQEGSASGAPDADLDSGVRAGIGIVGARVGSGRTPHAGTTEDFDSDSCCFGRETAAGTGARTVGWDGNHTHAVVAAMYVEGDAIVVPDPPVERAGVPDGFSLTQGDPVVFASPFGIAVERAGIPDGWRVTAEGPAEVYLAVPGRERPQLTEGLRGDGSPAQELDRLSWHPARKPTWEPVSGGAGDLTSLHVDLSVSGARDVDRDDGATHDLTLVGSATLTPTHSDPPTGEAIDLRVLVRQDGTGSHTLAWGGTITWEGGSAPTMPTAANSLLVVGLLSVDDATTWLGFVAEGGGTSDVESLDDLDDVTITTPTEGDTLRYRSGEWVNEALSTEAGLIPVDTGTLTIDDGDPFGLTVTSLWGIDPGGDPYYDDANVEEGDEASLWWDPALSVYTLIPFEFPEVGS